MTLKKTLFAGILTLILLLSATGCSAAGAADTLDRVEDRLEEKLDAAGDTLEKAARRAVTPAPSGIPGSSAPSAGASFDPITKEEAEKIALEHLQFSRDQVKHLRTEYEIDRGICLYDVQFLSGEWEYEYKVSAEDGRILSWDREAQYD